MQRLLQDTPFIVKACAAEALGTFLLVLFGTGAVAASVFTGAHTGLWQVAAVWGFGVALAIYVSAAVSGAHLNPAVSLAFAVFRRSEFPLARLLPYWFAQLLGASLAGLAVLWAFGSAIRNFETSNGIIRGETSSVLSAMAFGEYFPNPALFPDTNLDITPWHAFAVEAFGTAILVLVIFSLIDRRNAALTNKGFAPFLIGFTVAALIALFAPITQAGWNPARDFGPRIVAYFAGWNDIAIPGPDGGFWVYIAGPLVGGLIGAAIFEVVIAPGLKHAAVGQGDE